MPGTKTKRPRRIPISMALHAILVRRQLRAAGEAYAPLHYVFGHENGSRVRDIKTAWSATVVAPALWGSGFTTSDMKPDPESSKPAIPCTRSRCGWVIQI